MGELLPAGTELAIKVVRPGVEESILRDVQAAKPVIETIAKFGAVQRFNLPALLDEFSASLSSECDLRNEARMADRFAFDFRDDDLVMVPRVVWPLTSKRVMAMEFVEGWRLSDIDDAARKGIDGRALAVHGANVFMRGVMVLGRYHADLHPANVFVTPDGRICYLDFGIVGRTAPAQREAIAQVLAATVYGDADSRAQVLGRPRPDACLRTRPRRSASGSRSSCSRPSGLLRATSRASRRGSSAS